MITRSQVMPIERDQAAARRQNPAAVTGCLVVVDLGVDEAGAVVDRGVDEAVAAPAGLGLLPGIAVAADAPAATVGDPGQFLHVDMDQLTGMFPLIAAARASGAWRWPGRPGRAVPALRDGGSPAPSTRPGRPRGRCGPHPNDACGAAAAPADAAAAASGSVTAEAAIDRSSDRRLPSARNRSRHLRTVFASTWNRSAVASSSSPARAHRPPCDAAPPASTARSGAAF